ncbi:Uncharacterised protein [Mycobacteroides abscessus subsp. bolletii]|nr:Uncharacterised protein [Mycobacteroides abscessus subsp. bolletii]SKN46476.1 Uncharacterised protein [Mycobacteroides abscessus subsp. bolletii]SKU72701.1 Uncharacterised protein [Mycobacteroides abscessus subsp. bolletii]SKX29421.1 Uncharacterised protein [Mycobacteroides abscessus subsp. bolletii]SLC30255.1 Uncharacterised protein [Mycobacteroides abscessus subsp. bolletii]
MSRRSAAPRGAGDRASVTGTAPLILGALLFTGMLALGATTGNVPAENKALLFAPVFYSLTVMGGLIASFPGFSILETVLRRRHDPEQGWTRAALTILVLISALFVVACMFALPVVALGVSANGLGVGIDLLWSARGPRDGSGAFWALLWVSLALAAVAAAWTTVAILGALS